MSSETNSLLEALLADHVIERTLEGLMGGLDHNARAAWLVARGLSIAEALTRADDKEQVGLARQLLKRENVRPSVVPYLAEDWDYLRSTRPS